MPCKPGATDAQMDDMVRKLLKNFDAFTDPRRPDYITTKSIRNMAKQPFGSDPVQNANIRLANALVNNPQALNAIDRHSSTGALDGRIRRQEIEQTLSSQSPLKYLDDSGLAQEMLDHFQELKDPANPGFISIAKLRGLASWSTSNPIYGRLAWIAKEVLKRSEVMKNMDAGDHLGKDGWIHWNTLLRMSRG